MRSAPLSKIGFLQYISPTMQFLLGVLVYNEAFSSEKLIGFSIIWLGLIIYLFGGGLQQARRISASKSV
jgi:chloramphenicol-sensitive protein RarD